MHRYTIKKKITMVNQKDYDITYVYVKTEYMNVI